MKVNMDKIRQYEGSRKTSTLHHDIFTYLVYIFSCYLHTVGFYPYLLSYCLFGKNKYQIHSYITFNMDDS